MGFGVWGSGSEVYRDGRGQDPEDHQDAVAQLLYGFGLSLCRLTSAILRKSRSDYGLVFQVKVLRTL